MASSSHKKKYDVFAQTTLSSISKYDVFLSFRGEDTRNNLVSHLCAAFSRANILTFIDYHLERGEEIEKSLEEAIEESKISVIIFSQNYATSKWTLQELVKILYCKNNNGQIVIPVFYLVDPSHVRKQEGSFGVAFHNMKAIDGDMMKIWKSALTEAANISGFHSLVEGTEAELLDDIVRSVLIRLNRMTPVSPPTGLVGLDSRIKRIYSLLCMESSDVRTIGLWGLGGIGKTSLARAVFYCICTQFESSFFLEYSGGELASDDLRDKMVSQLLHEESRLIGAQSIGAAFIRDRLQRKKVLIVLDGVDSLLQLQKLQDLFWADDGLFGPGSRILVTSRDKQVLNNVTNAIYEVKCLNADDALLLFCLKAFKKENCPSDDYAKLSMKVVSYAKGNPLALKILGSALYSKSKEVWNSALQDLNGVAGIEEVLRISYDGLQDMEKDIFLDIACFFRGEHRHHVTKILENCYPAAHFKIRRLIDKSLLTISSDKFEMHDLLQEMGRNIVYAESRKNAGERSRLWNHKDIHSVLTKKKGTEAVQGLFLNLSEVEELHLDSDAFVRMHSLRLLKFYVNKGADSGNYGSKVQLPPDGLCSISDELRRFHWHGFPSKSLPKFCAENLVELLLPESNVEQLWQGEQELVNLRKIDLTNSRFLTTLPELSKSPNMKRVILNGCTSLEKLPLSFQCLNKLEVLDLRNCQNLEILPPRLDFQRLQFLHLEGCSKVRTCPEIRGQVHHLFLSGTAIIELPSSIEFVKGLSVLQLIGCKELLSLPPSICKLKSLETIVLEGCLKFESFPEILEPMDRMRFLNLNDCENLKELPNCFQNMKYLDYLGLRGTAIRHPISSIGFNTLCEEGLQTDDEDFFTLCEEGWQTDEEKFAFGIERDEEDETLETWSALTNT